MDNEELQKAGRELVLTYNASGLGISDIAAVLYFALEAVARDPETTDATIQLLAVSHLR